MLVVVVVVVALPVCSVNGSSFAYLRADVIILSPSLVIVGSHAKKKFEAALVSKRTVH